MNLDRKHFASLDKKPDFGIYYGTATVLKKKYKAGIIIGPLDKKGLPKVEAHLLGFSKNVYGKKVTIEIKKFIRKFKKFKREEDLVAQIRKDILFVSQQ